METQTIVAILNELLMTEQGSLAVRLTESTVFVSHSSVEDSRIVQQMVRAGEEHGAWLTHAILQLGGVPGPRNPDTMSADLHFQELRRLLPRLLADREALVRKYALAAQRFGRERQAGEVVGRILERHQEELTSLQRLGGQSVSAAS